jgi:polyisoprenoid-binding protein YceI
MTGRLLTTLLLFAPVAAQAEKAWVFEPGQAMVSVEVGPKGKGTRLSAVSHGLSGQIRELDGGTVQAEVRLHLASFLTGSTARDHRVKKLGEAEKFPDIVFQGAGLAPGRNGAMSLKGTLTFHGMWAPLEVPVTVVRAGSLAFGHATLSLHLRDFGFDLPPGTPDEVRVEVDAGLRPAGALASRG